MGAQPAFIGGTYSVTAKGRRQTHKTGQEKDGGLAWLIG